MLQLLLERGQSYDDLASILGVGPGEVRARARAALTELAGVDPDRNVALTDYMLGQADPIDRADAVRHLKDDPEDLATATELAQKLRLVAPEAQLPRLPGSPRQPQPRRKAREVPAPLRKLLPARRGGEEPGEPRPPRTTLTRRQTQWIVVAGCAAVLIAVGALAIAGVFSGSSETASSATATTSTNAAATRGKDQGYPLVPIGGANSPGGAAKLTSDGSFQDSIPIPSSVQSIVPQVESVRITLVNNNELARSIQQAVQSRQAILAIQGKTVFRGVIGARQGRVVPIKFQQGKDVNGSGAAALGVENRQPFFQVRLQGLEQPAKGESYIIWLVVSPG
jgi:hypothetical protein